VLEAVFEDNMLLPTSLASSELPLLKG